MKIYTLWKDPEDETAMPWLLDAIDEYTIEENNGFTEDYRDHRAQKGVRELIIDINEAAVLNLFKTPKTSGTIVQE